MLPNSRVVQVEALLVLGMVGGVLCVVVSWVAEVVANVSKVTF